MSMVDVGVVGYLELRLDLGLNDVYAAPYSFQCSYLAMDDVSESRIFGSENGIFLQQLAGAGNDIVCTPKCSLGVEGALRGYEVDDQIFEGLRTILTE